MMSTCGAMARSKPNRSFGVKGINQKKYIPIRKNTGVALIVDFRRLESPPTSDVLAHLPRVFGLVFCAFAVQLQCICG